MANTTSNSHGTVIARKSPKGVIVEDGDHQNYFTGSRYGWRVLLVGRKELPDQHALDVASQQTGRTGIPYSDVKDARILRSGYVQS